MNGNDDGLEIAEDGLAELVCHYSHIVAVAPSAAVYDEIVSARSFAGMLLGRGSPARRPELAVTTGWLSSLLAISATDLGDHAAALVWCADTERRGREARYPGAARLGRTYPVADCLVPGRPGALCCCRAPGPGRGASRDGRTAKLAAQEMRCLAMAGDTAGMSAARRRAATAMSQLGPSAPTSGIYSVPRAEDPPYTATSLLLAGRHARRQR